MKNGRHDLVRGAKSSWFQLVAFFALLLIVVVWLLVFQQIANDRLQLRRSVSDHAGNIAVTLSHNISRTSSELDTLLKFMRAMHKSKGKSATWQEIITEDYTLNRHTVQIAIIAKDGMMVTSTKMLYPPHPVDLSDREHYLVHRDGSGDRLFISKPILGRASGKWSVQFTRPLFDDAGGFDGVIVVSLDPDKLTRIYGDLELGHNGAVVIVGDDGIIRAGTGDYADKLGKTYKVGTGYRDFSASGASLNASLHAGLEQHGTLTKIVAKHDVDGHPLHIEVLADDVGGTAWMLKVQALIIGAILFSILTVYATIATLRHRTRESRLLSEQNRFLVEKTIAETASRTKGEFLAVMSHEIRTPLNGVLGALDLLKTERLPRSAVRHLETASNSGEYLLSLIDDILIYSKLEEGNFKLDRTPQSLSEIFVSLNTMFRPLAQKAGNTLFIDTADDFPAHVKCDAVRLRQVLLNFLSNANKFTSNGTIVLSGAVLERDSERARIKFSVTDAGIGIPKDKQVIIFEKFQSLDASYSRRSDGTGLGLAICSKIVNAMGSHITLDSDLGKGSTFAFTIDFEIVHQGPAEMECDLARPEIRRRGMRVLLAEDNHTNAYIAAQYLTGDGHEVARVENGNEAVAAAQAARFDLILMDISMPEKDGLTAAREIRQQPGPNSATPIVALTAHIVDGTEEKVADAGMNAYLSKPIRRARLLETIRRLAAAQSSRQPEPAGDHAPAIGTQPAPAMVQAFTARSAVAVDSEAETEAAVDADAPSANPIQDVAIPLIDTAELAAFFDDREIDASSPLVVIFLSELENKQELLANVVTRADVTAAGRIAHAIFGSASTVGAARLAAQAKRIEDRADAVDGFDWAQVRAFQRTLTDTIAEFHALAYTPPTNLQGQEPAHARKLVATA